MSLRPDAHVTHDDLLEGEEISERVVMQQFALEPVRTVNQFSTIAGLLGNLVSFGRLFERRLYPRRTAAELDADPGAEHAVKEKAQRRPR